MKEVEITVCGDVIKITPVLSSVLSFGTRIRCFICGHNEVSEKKLSTGRMKIQCVRCKTYMEADTIGRMIDIWKAGWEGMYTITKDENIVFGLEEESKKFVQFLSRGRDIFDIADGTNLGSNLDSPNSESDSSDL